MYKRKIGLFLSSAILLVIVFLITDTTEVWHSFSKFPVSVIFVVMGLLALNLLVVTYRLKRVLHHFDMALPMKVVAKASVSGYIAGLFFVSLFGQVAGRHLILNKYGVPSVFLAFLTAYERIVLFIISGSLCVLGAIYILDNIIVAKFIEKISFLEIIFAASGGLILSLCLGRSKFESYLISRTQSLKNIFYVIEIAAITFIAQLFIFSVFVLGVLVLQPNINMYELLAAVVITSFAASIPISVNGWGVRELAAVYSLGHIGVSSANALAVSILVGICSTVIIILSSPIALKKQFRDNAKIQINTFKLSMHEFGIEKAAVWLLITSTAILIFFQIHVNINGGLININLADPFAILALTATLLHVATARQLPLWRIPQFNMMLVVITVLLIFSFFNGVLEIGFTQWALAGRVFGWLVLLGYISVGYLTVVYLGAHGARRLFETMVSTAVVVIIVQILLRLFDRSGWLNGLYVTPNFEGFSGNRNAFAFQMLVCLILMLAYSTVYTRVDRFDIKRFKRKPLIFFGSIGRRQLLFSLLTGFILAGLIFSASRAGLITGALILIFTYMMKISERRFLLLSLFFALLIWCLPNFIFILIDSTWAVNDLVASKFSSEGSNIERWLSISKGLAMWLDSPIFGSGLGVFIEKSIEWHDKPLVIHNTAVWILAEFGLLGAIIFLSIFIFFIHFLYKNGWKTPMHRVFVMLLLIFSLFSLVHEIFYQRIFWLILGVIMAVSICEKNIEKQNMVAAINV